MWLSLSRFQAKMLLFLYLVSGLLLVGQAQDFGPDPDQGKETLVFGKQCSGLLKVFESDYVLNIEPLLLTWNTTFNENLKSSKSGLLQLSP